MKAKNIFEDLSINYVADFIGVILGLIAAELPFLQRKYSFFLINCLISISYLICGVVSHSHSVIIHFILRLLLLGFLTINALYNYEIYPTMIRPIGASINRVRSRLFNLGTPFLIIAYPQICYYLGASLALINCVVLCIFPIMETRNIIIMEYPPKYKLINERINKEDASKEEEEEVLKKMNHY